MGLGKGIGQEELVAQDQEAEWKVQAVDEGTSVWYFAVNMLTHPYVGLLLCFELPIGRISVLSKYNESCFGLCSMKGCAFPSPPQSNRGLSQFCQ